MINEATATSTAAARMDSVNALGSALRKLFVSHAKNPSRDLAKVIGEYESEKRRLGEAAAHVEACGRLYLVAEEWIRRSRTKATVSAKAVEDAVIELKKIPYEQARHGLGIKSAVFLATKSAKPAA